MSTDINLLAHADETALKRARRQKLVSFLAIVFLIAISVITVIIFMLIQGVNLNGIKKEQEDVIRELSKYESQQVDLFIINNRSQNIKKIFNTRENIAITIDGLMAKMPDDFLVNEIKVDSDTVTIGGEASSLVMIGEVIRIMTDMARNKELINSLTLESLKFKENDINEITEGNLSEGYYVSLRADL